ncbi:hypothetical protein ASG52_13875 [Methylobacterium sp. Leaf456]|uniref:hypothetical protein n=1 Tax=Methylobacterium sp. Leaf456 TaxID=1736382 RepID=UPI0006FC8374|nr:hypothetical protein [Methylobacterium sp. Leaf456]KQT46784.1 hypothetical protein ASG52_13875 [Methylobacterium sp. Leaf456]
MPPSLDDNLVADARDESQDDLDDLRDLARPRTRRRARLAAQLTVCAALIAGLSLAARERMTAPEPRDWADPPRSEAAAPRKIASAEPLLTLTAAASDLPAPPPQAEPSRWDPTRGQREDSVSQGRFDAIEAPWLVVTATDPGAARAEPAPSLFVTLVRRAADGRGLSVTRTGERGVVATRYGSFETVETVLSGDGARTCTGFRSLDLHSVRLDGWLCGILGQAPEKRAVACAIERIALSGRVAAALGAEETGKGSIGTCAPEAVAGVLADHTGSIAVAAAAGSIAGASAGRHIAAKRRRK